MVILVTNDDGINAKGVHELIDRLLPYGEVICVCPDGPRSGQSMAITVNGPIPLHKHPDYHGAKMYSIGGTPVDCVKLSMHHILPRSPDLVVSGINHGSNAAVNVLYSGTMGAAMEGCAFGIPSIGFSLTDHNPEADFNPCFKAIDTIVPDLIKNGLPKDICLNVNIPNIPDTPSQMKICTPCRGRWNDEYKAYLDPHGNQFFWLTGEYENLEPDNPNTDEWALSHGFVSVVPVCIERSTARDINISWLQDTINKYNG